jgi:hypothetical protein
MSNKNKQYEFPSMYDFFYSNYKILQLLNPELVNSYLSKNKLNSIDMLRGYSYLFELVIIDLIHNVESIIQEEDISEAIHWGHIDITNKTLIQEREKNFLLNQIYVLNKLRGQISKVRFKQSKLNDSDEQKIKLLIGEVLEESEKIDSQIQKEYTIKRINKSKQLHDLRLLSYVINRLNYIEGDIDFFDSKKEVINAFPMNPTSYLLPNGFRKSYYLQNELIKKFNEEYFTGYKQTVFYLYSSLIKKNKKVLIDLMDKATDWHPFHMLGSLIREKYVIEFNYNEKIFDMKSKRKETKLPTLITTHSQLDLIFRRINNLDIKIFKDRHEGDYPNTHAMFEYFLMGAINIQKEHLEVVEFEQIYGDDKIYSYSIYVPVNGGFWSSSHWFFFEDLTIVNSWEPFSQIKMLVEETNKRLNIDFKQYKINGDLLKQYTYQKDFYKQFSKRQEVKLNKSKGLLGETIAYYYLAKKYNAVLVEMHKDIKNTDIDVLAKNKDTHYLVQSKVTLPFKDKDVIDLILYFEKVEKVLNLKKTKRIVFVMDDYVSDSDSSDYMDDEELDGLSMIDVSRRNLRIKKVLSDKNIEIVTYDEIKKELKTRDSKHLFAELDIVFDNF